MLRGTTQIPAALLTGALRAFGHKPPQHKRGHLQAHKTPFFCNGKAPSAPT